MSPKLTVEDLFAMRQELARRGQVGVDALNLPPKLAEIFREPSRYKIARGGRGSGKTRAFSLMSAIMGDVYATQGKTGVILCAREFQNSLDDSSFAEVVAAINSDPYLMTRWIIGQTFIRHVSGRVEYIFRGLRHNRDSLKGISRILLAWADEAEQVLEESWAVLIPTVREEGSEIWLTFNPEKEKSATNQRFVENATPDMRSAVVNWSDNQHFPEVLNEERLRDQEARPDDYGHVWEGEYKITFKGSYYAAHLTLAEKANRITTVSRDPLMTTRAYWDIGGTGQKADATAVWIVQFVGQNINFLDHYEAVGQPLSTHVAWLRKNGYDDALCVLPHDGINHEKIYKVTYESALREAGFQVRTIPNQGAGAALLRVEAMRRLFPRMWFNEETTASGRAALRAYREKWSEERDVGLGPLHDWASNSADAAGLAAIDYEAPKPGSKPTARRPVMAGGWMG